MKLTTKKGVMSVAEFNTTYKKKTKVRHEEKIQLKVCEFLKKNYNVIFMCDLASGMNLGKHIGGMNSRLRSSRGLPDLFIAHSIRVYEDKFDMMGNDIYKDFNGLFLELKKEGTKIFKKDGSMVSDLHLSEQAHVLSLLRDQNYIAEFSVGYDQTIETIKKYLGEPC